MLFAGAEILLTVSGVPLGNADGEVETAVDQSAVGDQMELQVETEIQDDEVTAGECYTFMHAPLHRILFTKDRPSRSFSHNSS
jgi:hypothetical protein